MRSMIARAQRFGAKDVQARAQGEDRFILEFAGTYPTHALTKYLGSVGRLGIYHARNSVSGLDRKREFAPETQDGGKMSDAGVSFVRSKDQKRIAYGSPEYTKMIQGWTLVVGGEQVASAKPIPSGVSFQPLIEFNSVGTKLMSAWSSVWEGKQEPLAIVLDGKVLSIANVEKSAVITSNVVISGSFETEYVKGLTDLISSGGLPAEITLLGSNSKK
jgi:preprotein translocase subunit SecD